MYLRKFVAAERQSYQDKLLNAGITETRYGKRIWDCTSTELKRELEYREGVARERI